MSLAEAARGCAGESGETCVWQDNTVRRLQLLYSQNPKRLVLHRYISNKIIFMYQVYSKQQEIIIYWQNLYSKNWSFFAGKIPV